MPIRLRKCHLYTLHTWLLTCVVNDQVTNFHLAYLSQINYLIKAKRSKENIITFSKHIFSKDAYKYLRTIKSSLPVIIIMGLP